MNHSYNEWSSDALLILIVTILFFKNVNNLSHKNMEKIELEERVKCRFHKNVVFIAFNLRLLTKTSCKKLKKLKHRSREL